VNDRAFAAVFDVVAVHGSLRSLMYQMLLIII
jgi:hypothetical protein